MSPHKEPGVSNDAADAFLVDVKKVKKFQPYVKSDVTQGLAADT